MILGIYYKLQTFLYLPANGMIQGMRPVISYNYGAGEHKRVRSIYNITLTIIGLIMVFGTVISLLRYVVVIIPAAFVLSCICGVVGAWNAFWVAELITAAAAFFIYRQAFKRKS